MPRIPLATRDSLANDELKSRWDRLEARGPVLNIQRAFLASPELDLNVLSAWRASGLDARARELVILRAAFAQQSTYEWHQHVRIARAAGLSDAEMNAVRDWRAAKGFSEDERALLAYVDEMAKGRPSDESFAAMAKGRDPGRVVGITVLISTYFSLARVMAALDLETEDPFVGWEVGG
jgi:alkylhydroperoxidase family enzyme